MIKDGWGSPTNDDCGFLNHQHGEAMPNNLMVDEIQPIEMEPIATGPSHPGLGTLIGFFITIPATVFFP